MADAPEQQGSNTFDWLVLDTLRRMRDAQAEGDTARYFTHFEYAFQMVIPWLSLKTRDAVQKDYDKYTLLTKSIRDSTVNDATKSIELRALKENFANAHRVLIFASLSRLGIIHVSDEGVINFETLDIDQMAAIVRSQKGLEKITRKVMGKQEGDNAGAKTDTANVPEAPGAG